MLIRLQTEGFQLKGVQESCGHKNLNKFVKNLPNLSKLLSKTSLLDAFYNWFKDFQEKNNFP